MMEDASFGQRQVALYELDLQRSHRITQQGWQSRPLADRVPGTLALVLRSQL